MVKEEAMKDTKREINEVELDDISGGKGPSVGVNTKSPPLTTNIADIIAILNSGNYDTEEIIASIKSLSPIEMLNLAMEYLPGEITSGLISKIDKETIFIRLVQEIRNHNKIN